MSIGTIDVIPGKTPALSVGVLSADIMSLAADIKRCGDHGVTLLHFDVMDGHFVPQLTIGPSFVKAVRTTQLKDVHLMIEDPFATIPLYAAAGADIITIHVESCVHVLAVLQRIAGQTNANNADRRIVRGIAINPSTPLSSLEPVLEETDIVTLLAINPGFSGQTLLADTALRAGQVHDMIARSGRRILLCIDGGVTKKNIVDVARMKPDIVVSGSAIFENNEIEKNLDIMNNALSGK